MSINAHSNWESIIAYLCTAICMCYYKNCESIKRVSITSTCNKFWKVGLLKKRFYICGTFRFLILFPLVHWYSIRKLIWMLLCTISFHTMESDSQVAVQCACVRKAYRSRSTQLSGYMLTCLLLIARSPAVAHEYGFSLAYALMYTQHSYIWSKKESASYIILKPFITNLA